MNTWHDKHIAESSFGDRVADSVANTMGSWKFIIWQTVFVLAWMILNSVHGWGLMWDGYPFILLNLLFSTQAAYAAPVIMMSQNRAAARDRAKAQHDLEVNVRSLAIVEEIANHFDIRLDEIEKELDT